MGNRQRPDSSRALETARRRSGAEILPVELDRPGLESLTREVYPDSDIADREYIRWQIDLNPAGPAVASVARVKGGAAASYTVVPLRAREGGRAVTASLSVNTMTHPDHRGKGLFMVLAEDVYSRCRERGYAWTLGFPNGNSHKGFLRHLGFQELGRLPLCFLPLDPGALARSRLSRFHPLRWASSALSPLWKFAVAFSVRKKDPGVEESFDFGEDFDRFWEEVQAAFPNAIARDRRYLRWRYQEHPTRRYRVWTLRTAGRLEGFVVGRTMDVGGVRCGMLVDALVRGGPAEVPSFRRLARRALRGFLEDKAGLAAGLFPRGSAPFRGLRRMGFLPCPERFLPQQFPVILRRHDGREGDPAAGTLQGWYLTMGDYDAV